MLVLDMSLTPQSDLDNYIAENFKGFSVVYPEARFHQFEFDTGAPAQGQQLTELRTQVMKELRAMSEKDSMVLVVLESREYLTDADFSGCAEIGPLPNLPSFV